jgi:hypothetical protein
MFWLGDPLPRGPLHVDVGLKLWTKSDRTTVREVRAAAAGQKLHAEFRAMTLELGSAPEEQNVKLRPPDDQALVARAGDTVTLELLLTRGRARKLRLPITPERT